MVHHSMANQSTQYSLIKLLKYWFKNKNNGPSRPQSEYTIPLLVIWAIWKAIDEINELLDIVHSRQIQFSLILTTNLFVTLAATIPNASMYKVGYVSKMWSTDFSEMINAGSTISANGITGEITLVPCDRIMMCVGGGGKRVISLDIPIEINSPKLIHYFVIWN